MITRCYLEITNVCNLDCLFCPKTVRSKHKLTTEEFDRLTDKLSGQVKFLYLHLMGEPFLHPHLGDFVRMVRRKGMVPILTTNGTLLSESEEVIRAHPHKIQISLHSHEGNGKGNLNLEQYIQQVMSFAEKAANQGILVVLRLWNQGGYDSTNGLVLDLIARYQSKPWVERHDGWKLADYIYVEYDRMFKWPDEEQDEFQEENVFCYALRNQVGVLVDGSVVPCCLDHNGTIVLGNLFEQSLEDILASPRARALYEGFTKHEAVEPLCRRCGYATITKRYRQ